MSDQQVKEFFSSVLEGGPADRLDLDRAVATGCRRRRLRTATTLASAAAVLVVVGALVVSALPDKDTGIVGAPTGSASPTGATVSVGPDTVIGGSPNDWATALESYLPQGTETPAVRADGIVLQSMPEQGHVAAVFRFVRDGRRTALVVSAAAIMPESRSQDEVYADLSSMEPDGSILAVEKNVAESGPTMVRRWRDGSHVTASSVRSNGVVVTVESWNADTNETRILDGSGEPGLIDQVDSLVAIASTVPLPALLVPSSSPIPTVEATTSEPSPDPQPTASGPIPTPIGTTDPRPTPTPTPKPAGLVGAYASEACERVMTYEYRIPRPITGEVLQYVVCPYEEGGTLVPYSVSPERGATFSNLDAALRQPDELIAGGCRLVLIVLRPIFVQTADGWFRAVAPTDRCGNPQQQVQDAVAAIVG